MSTLMEDEIKRWTARLKAALVLEIIQGKTTVAEASRAHARRPRRSSSGSKMARRAWRMPCTPTLRTCASSTRSS